jgi:hypothetical protein
MSHAEALADNGRVDLARTILKLVCLQATVVAQTHAIDFEVSETIARYFH